MALVDEMRERWLNPIDVPEPSSYEMLVAQENLEARFQEDALSKMYDLGVTPKTDAVLLALASSNDGIASIGGIDALLAMQAELKDLYSRALEKFISKKLDDELERVRDGFIDEEAALM